MSSFNIFIENPIIPARGLSTLLGNFTKGKSMPTLRQLFFCH